MMLNLRTGKEFTRRDLLRMASVTIGGAAVGSLLPRQADAMNLGLRTTAWHGAAVPPPPVVPTARDYVQDGLIAMWDGKENAGWGVHDPNATVWKDLTSHNLDFRVDFDFASWENDAFTFHCRFTNKCAAKITEFDNSRVYSVEAVVEGEGRAVDVASAGAIFSLYNGQSIGFASLRTGDNGVGFGALNSMVTGNVILPNNVRISLSLRRGVLAAWDGSPNFTDGGVTQGDVVGTLGIGNLDGIVRGGRGKVFNIRMYDREINPSEIAHNYAVDKARFGLT